LTLIGPPINHLFNKFNKIQLVAGKLQIICQFMDTYLAQTRTGLAVTSHVNQTLADGIARAGGNTRM
jgi:hypothetical protein